MTALTALSERGYNTPMTAPGPVGAGEDSATALQRASARTPVFRRAMERGSTQR